MEIINKGEDEKMNNEIMVYEKGAEAIIISNSDVGFFKGEHVKYVSTKVGEQGFQWHSFENQYGYVYQLTDADVLMKGHDVIIWNVEYIPHKESERKTMTILASIIDDAVRKLRFIEPRANIVKVEMVEG